jgi:hypothetical protein
LFVPDRPFQPSRMFMGEARAHFLLNLQMGPIS